MARVVIFGVHDFAQLGSFYLKHDTDHEVVAFSVHAQYMPEGRAFEGLPVVPFEEVEATFKPSDVKFFAPLGHNRMNRARESVYL